MDRIIFGDNQFFGINHMSEEKARAQAMKFKDVAAVIRTIDMAYDCGIRGFMFSAHDRVADVCDHFRAHPDRYADLRLYPVLPYAHKYASAVAEKGVLGAIQDSLAGNVLGTLARGSLAVAKQDLLGIARLLVDVEMRMFRNLRCAVVFLQNIVADLMLGLGLKDVSAAFAGHIRQKYGAEPGFITMNLPRMVDFLLDSGVENPVVCSAVNPIGYYMNPGRRECEQAIAEKPFRAMAMSILAAGAVAPREAIEYLRSQKRIESVVFGASTKAHIEQTKAMIENGPAA